MKLAVTLLVALCGAVKGGQIRGVVLENQSGHPMAHATVAVDQIAGETARRVGEAFTDRSGGFLFLNLPPGVYLVRAQRRYYAEVQYGQTRVNRPGRPVMLAGQDSDFFAEIRLPRLAAVVGTVFDENRMGVPEQAVLFYEPTLPYRLVATTKTDDRGVYRQAGLAAGTYLIRSGSHEFPGGKQVVPTFHPEFLRVTDAKRITVHLDQEATDVDVSPISGKLSRIGGKLTGCQPAVEVRMVLSSDTGRKEINTICPGAYRFEGLGPGNYQILAESSPSDGTAPAGGFSTFREIFVDRDEDSVTLELKVTPLLILDVGRSSFRWQDSGILVRRKDLAGPGPVVEIHRPRTPLAPGYWELAVIPPPDHYTRTPPSLFPERPRRSGPSTDWYDLFVPFHNFFLELDVRPKAATLSGQVIRGLSEAVAFAPVYLVPNELPVRRALHGIRATRSNEQGRYEFRGLPPGGYWVVSSFDLEEATVDSLKTIHAPMVTLEEGEQGKRELTLYVPTTQ